MIHVIAVITAKPGLRDSVLEAFRANVPAVRAEEGCIEYGAAVDVDSAAKTAYGPDTFVVIEKWSTMDTLKAHGASAHMAAYRDKTIPMIASRAVYVMSPA